MIRYVSNDQVCIQRQVCLIRRMGKNSCMVNKGSLATKKINGEQLVFHKSHTSHNALVPAFCGMTILPG